jgi:hypothetical protein
MSLVEEKIARFAKDKAIQTEALAMLKVGLDKDDPPEKYMAAMIGNLLLRFHGIPAKTGRN